MKILAIETSCDETAIAIANASGNFEGLKFELLSSIIHSQVKLHAHWQGVVPTLAKREHSLNLIPLTSQALKDAKLFRKNNKKFFLKKKDSSAIEKLLSREGGLAENFINFISQVQKPKIDAVAVTFGPGLEPALWVGINFAKALSLIWQKPLIPVNHMNGHLISSLLPQELNKVKKIKIEFPALALLISGGHTELVLVKNWRHRKIIGQTRDDAVGEAFDKVARMLGLSYPGGPEISKIAKHYDKFGDQFIFPRPMVDSLNFDFSFSGLKTSVLYRIKNLSKLDDATKQEVAFQFEEAATDVLIRKTKKALEKFKVKTLLVGGGVIANQKIRSRLVELISNSFPDITLSIPSLKLTTDNAAMISGAAYIQWLKDKTKLQKVGVSKIKARGSIRLS